MPQDLSFSDWPVLLVLVLVGGIASAINAVAGGGTFLSFPVLVALGIPPINANASNSSGLWVGSLASAVGFSKLLPKAGGYLKTLFLPTLAGSILGAWLLVALSGRVFEAAVPVLIFVASLILAFQPRIKAWVDRRHGQLPPVAGFVLQFLVSVYGGYFGAGMGVMMLAAFALYIEGSIHELNALKTWLGVIINLTATVLFVMSKMVLPLVAAALAVGALVGGFAAAKYSQGLNSEMLRKLIAVYGFATAAFFAWRAFF